MLSEILVYILIGSISGFFAGLFGIGGGLIIIPCLYFVFHYLGYDANVIMHLCIGTAMASIIISSLSSALAHHKKKAVLWFVVKTLVPTMMLGSLIGAWIADALAGYYLQFLIGLFALWTGYNMLKTAKKQSVYQGINLPLVWKQRLVGVGIGVASSIFGIAGGSIIVPYLNHYGVIMQNAVATSSACGVPIAIMGAVGYLWFGSQQQINIANTIGYVHIYAFLGISIASFITAKLGVRVAHLLSPVKLKKYFAVEILLVGIYFIYKFLQQIIV